MKNYVGIDISKKDFYASSSEEDAPLKYDNSKTGLKAFCKQLKKLNFQPDNTEIGVESTGAYHYLLAMYCTNKGYTVKVINSLIVKKHNQTNLRRVKNDSKDSMLIRYCLVQGFGYPFQETPESILIRTILRQRNSLADLRRTFKVKQVDLELKETSLNIKLPEVNKDIISFVSEQMNELDKKMKQFEPQLQKLLQTIPGVGPITAISFIAELGNIERFSSSKKLTAFVGLDSRVHQSGTSINGLGYISKRGNKILRTRLFNASMVAVQRPNIFKTFFDKKISEGKPYMVALCATMHKMVHVIYAVWSRGTPFVA